MKPERASAVIVAGEPAMTVDKSPRAFWKTVGSITFCGQTIHWALHVFGTPSDLGKDGMLATSIFFHSVSFHWNKVTSASLAWQPPWSWEEGEKKALLVISLSPLFHLLVGKSHGQFFKNNVYCLTKNESVLCLSIQIFIRWLYAVMFFKKKYDT